VKASPSLRVHETDDGTTVKGVFDNIGNVSRNEEDYLDQVVLTGFEIDGNIANIDNDPETNQTGANLNYVRHCVLDNIHVHHTVNHSVIAGATEYLYVLNSRFEYAGAKGQQTTDAHISAPYGKQWYVNNYFNWTTDNAIYLNHCEGAYVAFNHFHDVFINAFDDDMNDVRYIGNSMTGTPNGPGWFHWAVGGSKNVVIRDNHWFDLGTGEDANRHVIISRGSKHLSKDVENVTIVDNTFELQESYHHAVRWNAPSENVTIANNTIKQPGRSGIRVGQRDPVQGMRIENNTIVDPNGYDDGRHGMWITNVKDLTVRGNSIRDTRDEPQMVNGVRLDPFDDGDWATVANNYVEGAVDAPYRIDRSYPHLRWNGLGYNEGDPRSTGQWNGAGIEGLTVRDTDGGGLYLFNGGQWAIIGD
jgi:hypothetical protein